MLGEKTTESDYEEQTEEISGPVEVPTEVASQHDEYWHEIIKHLGEKGEISGTDMVQSITVEASVTDGVTVTDCERIDLGND